MRRNKKSGFSVFTFPHLAVVLGGLTGVLGLFGFVFRTFDTQTVLPVVWIESTHQMLAAFVLIAFLMIVNGLYHAADASIAMLRKGRIEELKEDKDKSVNILEKVLEKRQQFFVTCQVGFQIARVGMIAISVLIAPGLAKLFFGDRALENQWVLSSIIIVIAFMALINLVFIELLFRSIARKNPEKWTTRMYSFLVISHVLFLPLIIVTEFISRILSKLLGVGPLFSPPVLTEEDIKEMVEASGETGELIEDEREMIHSIIEFTDTIAREVMTPRTDIDAVEVNEAPETVAKIIDESGHTRIPVYENTIDQVVGIIHAKDLLRIMANGTAKSLRELMRPAYFIPESKTLHQLLSEFRSGKTQMAIVQDEYGGTAGLVTIEDVVEEIVGDIVDEYDVEEPEVQETGEKEWSIDGRMHLEDVNDEIGSHFESDEFDTLGGYVFGLFGRQPSVGESIQQGPWKLTVLQSDGRRVQRVKVSKEEMKEEGDLA